MIPGNCRIAILAGGPGAEREVSLASAAAVEEALKAQFAVVRHVVDKPSLPRGLDPERDIVFPLIHGTYGEDGTLQEELEAGGFSFAGCDAACSRICIDKVKTKARARSAGVPVADELVVEGKCPPEASGIISRLGERLILKPIAEGSSVGLHVVAGEEELNAALRSLQEGQWLVEPRVPGHDITVGILDGDPLGIVEILPGGGTYDYAHKYTPGCTEYRFPAKVSAPVGDLIRGHARAIFEACGCRDFARVDFILSPDGTHTFLEVNTIPGMTATSLLPKSASCLGLSFPDLVKRMGRGAIFRFESSHPKPPLHP